MSSITANAASKADMDKIIASNGGGGVIAILTYKNIFNGGLTYKLVYKGQDAGMIASQITGTEVKTLWRKHV